MKKKYIIRLDDASEKRNMENWDRIEKLLDLFDVKPIVGIIPHNLDPDFEHYIKDNNFCKRVQGWQNKGWHIAMHGFCHKFETNDGGVNPVNDRSEFAGLSLNVQRDKIKNGYKIIKKMNVVPKIFFAPAHTFDNNTLEALRLETNIRIISDTIANDVYYEDGFYFIPQQSGKIRHLPFKTVTFCYHPNNMNDADFIELEIFLKKYKKFFGSLEIKKRRKSLYDGLLKKAYFKMRRKR